MVQTQKQLEAGEPPKSELVLVRAFEIEDPEENPDVVTERRIPTFTLLDRASDQVFFRGTITPLVRNIRFLQKRGKIPEGCNVEYIYMTSSGVDPKYEPEGQVIPIHDLLAHLSWLDEEIQMAKRAYRSDMN